MSQSLLREIIIYYYLCIKNTFRCSRKCSLEYLPMRLDCMHLSFATWKSCNVTFQYNQVKSGLSEYHRCSACEEIVSIAEYRFASR